RSAPPAPFVGHAAGRPLTHARGAALEPALACGIALDTRRVVEVGGDLPEQGPPVRGLATNLAQHADPGTATRSLTQDLARGLLTPADGPATHVVDRVRRSRLAASSRTRVGPPA